MNYYFDTARYLMGGYNVKLITPEKSLLSRGAGGVFCQINL